MVDRSKKNQPPAPQDRRNGSLPPQTPRFRRLFSFQVQVEVKVAGVDGSGFRAARVVAEDAPSALEMARVLLPISDGETESRRFIADVAEFEPEHAKKWGEWLDQTERAAGHWGGNQHRHEEAPTTTAGDAGQTEAVNDAEAPVEGAAAVA